MQNHSKFEKFEFCNVAFKYPNKNEYLFKDLSVSFKLGETRGEGSNRCREININRYYIRSSDPRKNLSLKSIMLYKIYLKTGSKILAMFHNLYIFLILQLKKYYLRG